MTARMTDLRVTDRPRERLFALGPNSLGDAELVAILLGSGRPGTNAVVLAQNMLARFGGLASLLQQGFQELVRVDGVGPAMAARFLSAAELCRRSAATGPAIATIKCSADLAAIAVPLLANLQMERLLLFPMTAAGSSTGSLVLAEGNVGQVLCPVPDVLQTQLTTGNRRFSLAHNHPSGNVEPSEMDKTFTSQVVAAARQCGLQLIDHVIVAGSKWKSIL